MYAYIDKDADVIDYQVQRADDEIGPYLTIGSVVKPSLGPWEVKFVDYTGDPMSRRYYYRITSRDSCGSLDTVSNIATNILLNAEAVGNLTCAITWSAYRDFDAGVDEYEVYRSINGVTLLPMLRLQKTQALLMISSHLQTPKANTVIM